MKHWLTVLVLTFPSQGTKTLLSTFSSAFSLFHCRSANSISLNMSLTALLSLLLPQNELPESHAKFHVLFLFFVAAMFCISILSLFSYHLWLVGKNRSTIGKKQAWVVSWKAGEFCCLFFHMEVTEEKHIYLWFVKVESWSQTKENAIAG